MSAAEASCDAVATALEARARQAATVEELCFSIVNDSFAFLPFRQALLFAEEHRHGPVLAISGLARPDEDSPYMLWLHRLWPWLREQAESDLLWFTPGQSGAELPTELTQGWEEWWPTGVLVATLRQRSGEVLGRVCFLLEVAPSPGQLAGIERVAQSWSYCWQSLQRQTHHGLAWRLRRIGLNKRLAAAVALGVLLCLPVRQSALAPAEVIALDASAVASPLDGVIKTIHVRPNQSVKAGQVLFALDDTTLRSRLEVAQKSVGVADAELMTVTQKAFDNTQSKGNVALLAGRAQEKRAELAMVQAQLQRVETVAERDGVVVYSDPDDWLGRPVAAGERIMQLADPAKPGVLIHLPAAEAVAFDIGAPVKFFLTVRPLQPLQALVSESSFQAVVSPAGVVGYRLRAEFVDAEPPTRIGLRGTAKIYGDRVPLVYALLRRPLATLRERSGW